MARPFASHRPCRRHRRHRTNAWPPARAQAFVELDFMPAAGAAPRVRIGSRGRARPAKEINGQKLLNTIASKIPTAARATATDHRTALSPPEEPSRGRHSCSACYRRAAGLARMWAPLMDFHDGTDPGRCVRRGIAELARRLSLEAAELATRSAARRRAVGAGIGDGRELARAPSWRREGGGTGRPRAGAGWARVVPRLSRAVERRRASVRLVAASGAGRPSPAAAQCRRYVLKSGYGQRIDAGGLVPCGWRC